VVIHCAELDPYQVPLGFESMHNKRLVEHHNKRMYDE
jgi:hypothetical protein